MLFGGEVEMGGRYSPESRDFFMVVLSLFIGVCVVVFGFFELLKFRGSQ